MSYILDALRRAEAERERGAVPSLQSQQHTVIEEDDAAPRSRRLMWVIVGLGGALLASLAWTFFGGSTPPARPAVEGFVAPTVAPAVVAPPPPNVALPVTTDTAPAAVPARVAAPTVASAPVPPLATQVVPPAPTAVRPPAVAAAEERRPARRVPSASAATLAAAPAACGAAHLCPG